MKIIRRIRKNGPKAVNALQISHSAATYMKAQEQDRFVYNNKAISIADFDRLSFTSKSKSTLYEITRKVGRL